jgi:hypothetical protein
VIHDRVAFRAQPRWPFSLHATLIACLLFGGAVVVALVLTDEAPSETAGPRATTEP